MDEINRNTELPVENEAPRAEKSEPLAPPPAEAIHYPSGLILPVSRPAPLRREPPKRGSGRDLALALVLFGFCFLLWDSLFWAEKLGLGEAIGIGGILPAALIYLKNRPGRMTGYGLVCTVLSFLGAASLAISGDGALKALTMMALTPLFVIVLLERLELRTGTTVLTRLRDLLVTWFGRTFGRIHLGTWALTHCGEKDSAKSKRNRAVLIGLLCAIPALLILVPLLISSDAAFAGMVEQLDWNSVMKGIFAQVPASFAALMLFSLLFTAEKPEKTAGNKTRKGIEPAAVAAFLGLISAAYVLYLISQFAYFTDAFRGLLPEDFTVAEYARRGFFEMCAIVAINLGLIILAVGLCRKEGGRVPAAVKALALFLCLFSLALVAAALSKMVLYMRSFGLTRLRVLTSAFMIFLAVVVVAKAIQLFAKKVPVAQLAVTLGAAILIALSLMNVDGMVARYNVDAWRTGRLESLDMKTICELGDGATPVLAELTREEDPAVSDRAVSELNYRFLQKEWRSWNLVTAQANAALEEVKSNKE